MKKTYIAPEMVIDSMITEELICASLSIIEENATGNPLSNLRESDDEVVVDLW